MSYKITDQAALNAILNAYKTQNWQLGYQLAYDALTDKFLNDTPKAGVDPAAWIWVAGARKVNAAEGAFGNYIRDYTARQYELRSGITLSETEMQAKIQDASNDIARNFLFDLLKLSNESMRENPSTAVLNSASGEVPLLKDVGLIDAAGAASRVFRGDTSSTGVNNYSPWAGTVLFTNLGETSFFEDWILNLGTSGFKVETGLYDLISAAQISTELKTVFSGLESLLELRTYFAVSDLDTGQVDAMAKKANDFLAKNYGAEAAAIDIGGSIFNDFSVIFESDERYNIGTLKNDVGGKAIIIKPDNVIIHAGVGNDEIKEGANLGYAGDEGVRIIDGGMGSDTLDYSASLIGVRAISDELGKPRNIDILSDVNSDDTDDTIDHVFDVETIIGSAHDDYFIGSDKGDSLEGGGGVDQLYGHSGSDTLRGGADTDGISGGGAPVGQLDYLVGGKGADIFEFNTRSVIMDATTEDFISWGGFGTQITGGSQLPWMEGGYAYYSPYSGLSAIGGIVSVSSLLGAQSVLTDLRMGPSFRFGLTESDQLLIQFGRGRGGVMVLNDYDLDVETGIGTGNVAVYKLRYVDGKASSLGQYRELANLALKAGFGVGIGGADPLILDMDGDGLELSREVNSEAYFDMDADGYAEHTAWVKKDDALLARDLNGNGKIDGIGELFGNATTSGFTALKALDANGDNKMTSADSAFGSLRVWQDADADGVTDTGELQTLAQAGIREISVASGAPSDRSMRGNTITAEAGFTRTDGTTSKIYDVQLVVNQTDSVFLGNSNVSTAAAALPVIKGYGDLPNLRIAMTSDATLLNLVTSFAALPETTSWNTLKDKVDDILFRWAKVQGVTPTAIGTGGLDARELAFMEKYFGYQLMPRDGGVPRATSAPEVLQSWNEVLDELTMRLAAQGPLKAVFAGAPYSLEQDHFVASGATSLTDTIAAALGKLSATASTALTQWNTHWAPLLNHYTDAMIRADKVEVRTDYLVQSILRAVDGKTLPLTLKQITDGLGLGASLKLGTTGNDTLARGSATGQHLFAGDRGNDTFTGGTGQDVYVFGRNFGKDVISDSDAQQQGDRIRLSMHTPSEVTIKRVADDLVVTVIANGDSITVKDHYKAPTYNLAGLPITPDRAIEEIQFADGTVMEAGDIAARVGLGTNGNDTIVGSSFFDEIEGLKGNDLLQGRDNGDTYYYTLGDGNDTIDDGMTTPTVNAPDSLVLMGNITEKDLRFTRDGMSQDLTISFATGAGSILLKDQFDYASTGFDTKLALNDRVEVFFFEQGGMLDWLQIQDMVLRSTITEGNDATYGFGTSDTIYGSTGNDLLVGIDGGDTYQFIAGGGQDTVHDQSRYPETFIAGLVGYSWGADDVVKFGEGISREDVTFARPTAADDLLVTLTTTGDTMLIKDQFDGTKLDLFNFLGVAWFDRVEKFIFADGTILTWDDVLEEVLTSSPGNDSLYGTYRNDTLDGGAGNDLLSGEDESDTYIFGRGYGQDVINEGRTNILSSDEDVLIFKSGITVSDIVFSRDASNPYDLLLSIKGTTDTLRIVDHYSVSYTGVFGDQYFSRIEKFIWSDGSVKTAAQITAEMMAVFKRPASELILGTTDADLLDSAGGNDTIDGGNAGDTYVFGTGYGHDVIRDGVSNILAEVGDTVRFLAPLTPANLKFSRAGTEMQDLLIGLTSSADTLTIRDQFTYFTIGSNHYQIDSFVFADGTIWTPEIVRANYLASRQTSANDVVIGFQYNETLTGGLGNDHLLGGDGADTYVFSKGFGRDLIQDNMRYVTIEYNQDKIQFDATILPANTRLLRYGNELDLTISFTDSTDRITVLNHFNEHGYYDIDAIHFSGGVVWTESFIKQNIIEQNSTTGADIIYGFADNDTINAKSGNDMISGYKGNDSITGGTGNDVIDGGEGDDVFLISQTQGWDIIDDYYGNADTLSFGSGITWDNTVFYRMDDNLMLKLAGGGTVLVAEGLSNGKGVESFRFADGVVKSVQDVITRLAAQTTITGSSGNDTLVGTLAHNYLDGGNGNDIFRIAAGAGMDVVDAGLGTDTIEFGSGISWTNIQFFRQYNDLYISLSDGGTVLVKNIFNGWGVENLKFSDGSIKTMLDIQQKLITQSQTAGADYITGFSTNDTISGGRGNDYSDGQGGNDLFTFNQGDGNDTIYGEFGSDTISFGAGLNWSTLTFSRSDGDVRLHFSAGDTVFLKDTFSVYGTETLRFADGTSKTMQDLQASILSNTQTTGNDVILGFDNSDVLSGGLGDDSMDGARGNDTLEGGNGADTIDGGDGAAFDTASYASSGAGVVVDLETGVHRGGDAQGDVLIEIDNLIGSGSNDVLTGDNKANLLQGGNGKDTLSGGEEKDTLDGGAGQDTLTGGAGADIFIFSNLTHSQDTSTTLDRITDFMKGEDKIDLRGLGFSALDTDGGNTETGELRLAYSASSNRTYVRTDQSTFEFYLDGDYSQGISKLTNDDFMF